MQLKSCLATASVAGALIAGSASAATVFVDNFNNNVVNDSDAVQGYWTPQGTTASSTLVESNGKLTYTTQVKDEGNKVSINGVLTDSSLTFPENKLTVSVRGITYQIAKSPNTRENVVWDFALVSGGGGTMRSANDAIAWRLSTGPGRGATDISVSAKRNDATGTAPWATTLFPIANTSDNVALTGFRVSGYDMELSPTGYSWTLYGTDTTTGAVLPSVNFQRNFVTPFSEADWDGLGAGIRMEMWATTSTSGGSVSVDSITIDASPVPEPASLGLFAGLAGVLIRRRTGR